MSIKSKLKKMTIWLVLSVAAFSLFLVLIFTVAQTKAGNRYLAGLMESGLSNGIERQVKIGRISGYIPFRVQLAHLTISDERSEWLVIEKVRLHWKPFALLRGRIHMTEVSAKEVRVTRLPHGKGKKQKSPWIPSWPLPLPPFYLERLLLERIHLSEEALGVNATFTLESRMTFHDPVRGLKGSMRIDRTDKPDAFAEVHWSLKGKKPFLSLDATAREDGEGLIHTLFGLKKTGPVFVSLKGEGPVNEWKGKLRAGADQLAHIESTMEFRMGNTLRCISGGGITIEHSLIPEKLSPFIRNKEIRFNLDTEYGRDNTLVLHSIHLDTESAGFMIKGKLDHDTKLMDAVFNLEIEDISVLGEITGNKFIHGNLGVQGTLSGPLRQPRAHLTVSLRNPAFADLSAEKITSEIQVEFLGKGFPSFQGVLTKGKGGIEGLNPIDKRFPLPTGELQWRFDADIRKGHPVTVNSLEIAAKNILMSFSGMLDPTAPFIEGNAMVEVRDPGLLSGIAGTELAGDAHVKGSLHADGASRTLIAEIEGRAGDLGNVPPSFAPLLKGGLKFRGNVTFHEGKYLNISNFNAASAGAEMRGECSIDLLSQDTRAKALILIPQLSLLSKPLKRRIEGTLELDIEIGGPFTGPRITATATGKGVVLEGNELQHLLIFLSAEDLRTRPYGSLHLNMTHKGYVMEANTDFTMDRQSLTLKGLSFSLPGTRLTGDLELDLHHLTAQGSLKGASDNLKSLSFIWGEEIGGSAGMDVSFSKGDRGQDVMLTLQGKNLESRLARVGELILHTAIKDIFHSREGRGDIELRSLKKGSLEFESLTLKAEGQWKDATLLLTGRGNYRHPFDVKAGGSISLSDKEGRLRLDSLEGRIGDVPVTLTRPAVARKLNNDYTLENAVFHLGRGSVRCSAKMSPASLSLNARIEEIPLETFSLIGFPYFTGSATAHIDITGRPDRPEGVIEIRARDLKSSVSTFQDIAPADLLLTASLKNNLFRGDISLDGLSERPLKAFFQVPAHFSLSPLLFDFGQKGGVQGSISAEIGIDRLLSFFHVQDQTLDGKLFAHFTIAGTINDPKIQGDLSLSGGAYEHARHGIMIKDIQVRVRVMEDRLVIENAHTTDGEKGSVRAKGWLQLLPGSHFPYQLDLDLTQFALLRRDDLHVTSSGHLNVTGSMAEATLSGNLTLGPIEATIPNNLPPEVKELEVIEINGPTGKNKRDTHLRQPATSRLRLDLQMEAPGRVMVRGRGLESEWKGKLHITGNTGAPILTGTMSILRGRYNFFGRPFDLSRGSLSFDGRNPPSPEFDVTGEHRRSDMTAHIQVSGSTSDPSFHMESDPPMPSDEILSRLLFGKGLANITPFQALRLAQAVNTLAGGRGGGILDFFDHTRKLLGVDQLEVKQSEEEKGGQTSVGLGKYIREDVYVEMEKGVGADSGKVSVEVELTPNITVDSEAGADAQGGVGINWKWDY